MVDTGASKALVSSKVYQQYASQLVARCHLWRALFSVAQCDQSFSVASGACVEGLFRSTVPLLPQSAESTHRASSDLSVAPAESRVPFSLSLPQMKHLGLMMDVEGERVHRKTSGESGFDPCEFM